MSHSGKLPLQQHNHPTRSYGLDDFMDEQHRRVMLHGVDLPGRAGPDWAVGSQVRTSDAWAVANSVPPQSGRVRRMAYQGGRWSALVTFEQPSLFPPEPTWFPSVDLVADA